MFRYLREEPGFCRVMYRRKDTGTLYALTDAGRYARPGEEYTFDICTRDGEPSHSVPMPPADQFDRLVYPRTPWRPRPAESARPPECDGSDPGVDCGRCDCWRKTRENCS